MFERQDSNVLVFNRVEYRIWKFRYSADSHARLEFTEPFGLANNFGDRGLYGAGKPLGCSPVENDGFAILLPSFRMKLENHC